MPGHVWGYHMDTWCINEKKNGAWGKHKVGALIPTPTCVYKNVVFPPNTPVFQRHIVG